MRLKPTGTRQAQVLTSEQDMQRHTKTWHAMHDMPIHGKTLRCQAISRHAKYDIKTCQEYVSRHETCHDMPRHIKTFRCQTVSTHATPRLAKTYQDIFHNMPLPRHATTRQDISRHIKTYQDAEMPSHIKTCKDCLGHIRTYYCKTC